MKEQLNIVTVFESLSVMQETLSEKENSKATVYIINHCNDASQSIDNTDRFSKREEPVIETVNAPATESCEGDTLKISIQLPE